MKDFTPYSVGFCCASVCTSLSIEEATRKLNDAHPTGISSKWKLSDDKTFKGEKELNGCACHDAPETHKHYLFNC